MSCWLIILLAGVLISCLFMQSIARIGSFNKLGIAKAGNFSAKAINMGFQRMGCHLITISPHLRKQLARETVSPTANSFLKSAFLFPSGHRFLVLATLRDLSAGIKSSPPAENLASSSTVLAKLRGCEPAIHQTHRFGQIIIAPVSP